MKRAILALVGAAVLAGCGASPHGEGNASVWITRDRGEHVVLVRKVPAGITAMDALQRVADVDTRYGGRFVQSIDGVSGSLSKKRDWFYFVNGYEADRGAADYKLHDGDVEWWDYRSWKTSMHVPIVVGAFPEPFRHGYDGKTRKATVVFTSAELQDEAEALGKIIGAKRVDADELDNVNVLFLTRADVPLSATTDGPGKPVRFVLGPTAARRLLSDRKLVRYRYTGLR
ncbi:MAG TPA: DUF4430 domain-containing protein [Gaiellaceae bacterium]|nr:DUF4430 domain-containing protein [Gaiellaceae bacterium]